MRIKMYINYQYFRAMVCSQSVGLVQILTRIFQTLNTKANTKTHKLLNLSKNTHKNKTQASPICKFKNCSHLSAYQCAQLSYTIQHKAVLIISCLSRHTVIIAQELSVASDGVRCIWKTKSVNMCLAQQTQTKPT